MSLDGNAMGDVILALIDSRALPTRRATFRAMGNAIVTHIATNGIAAAGAGMTTSAMQLWMSQVGGFVGAVPTFDSTAIVAAYPPTYSTVTATCIGTPGTVLPLKSAASVGPGGELFDIFAPAVIGTDGTVDALFQAESSGPVIAAAHALNTIAKPVTGWTGVDNSHAATPGVIPVALDGNVLGDLMQANIDALSPPQKRDRQQIFRAMGQAIVTHIGAVGIAATPSMVTWQSEVETTINALSTPAVPITPLSTTFSAIAIVK